eukprot:1161497-Pelagomonas_calceolata.AAC.3
MQPTSQARASKHSSLSELALNSLHDCTGAWNLHTCCEKQPNQHSCCGNDQCTQACTALSLFRPCAKKEEEKTAAVAAAAAKKGGCVYLGHVHNIGHRPKEEGSCHSSHLDWHSTYRCKR